MHYGQRSLIEEIEDTSSCHSRATGMFYFRALFSTKKTFSIQKSRLLFDLKPRNGLHLIPPLEPDSDNCKLHNLYDVQSCVLAGVIVLLGAVNCFYGKLEKNAIFWPFNVTLNSNVTVDEL